jgi:hypothetical protein
MPDQDEMRTEFERWTSSRGLPLRPHSVPNSLIPPGTYGDYATESAWAAWQAAYSAGKLAGAREALEKAATLTEQYPRVMRDAEAIQRFPKAIRALLAELEPK